MPRFEVDDEQIRLFIERFPESLRRHGRRAATKVGANLERFIKTQKLSGQLLKVRTGTGRRSIFHRVEERADDIEVIVGADLSKARYMRAHEKGAEIRPKRARFLTIPLDAVKTRGGVARFSARDVIARPGSFGYTGTFFRNHVLFGKRGDQAVPLFALKPAVTLRAVGYLSGSVQEQAGWIEDQFAKAVADALREDR